MELEDHPFVAGLEDEKRSQFLMATTIHDFSPRKVIFEIDTPSDAAYLVLEGEVAFTRKWSDDNPEQHIVSTCPEGGFFGEIGVITDHPRSLTAVAHTQVKVAKIPKDCFLSIVKVTDGSTPTEHLLDSVIQHLHHTTHKFASDMVEQEKMGMVGTMINGIMHDFRNPINTIGMSAQVLASEHADDLTQELCQNIENQIKYITEMANDISDFSQGNCLLRIEDVNLKELLEEFKASNPTLFDAQDIDIDINIDDITIQIDRTKIRRVLQNLIKNAVQAFRFGPAAQKENKHVSIKTQDLGEKIALIIKDNGSGVPENIKDNLFKPFVTEGKSRGTGLGMAIVKFNIEAHQGRINFDTSTDQGTTFTVILPKKHSKQAEYL